MKRVTVLIPAYNEGEVISQFYRVLNETCEKLSSYQFDYLFVNDGSTDNTITVIKELAKQDERIQYVDLSRNFGKEIAMSAGFDYAEGDAVVIIDADLQQPPSMIEEMVYWWEQGYDDVYAIRKERKGENAFKKWASSIYYKMLSKVTKEDIYPHAGDFRLLDRKCIDALKQLREQARYTKGMYAWIGFKKKQINYVAEPRAGGETKWKFSSLWLLAIDGITAYSTLPLKVWSLVGTIISLLGFIYLVIEIGKTLIFGSSVAGYPSMIASVLLLGGIQLISLGVIGEYLGRVFVETKERPLYFVQDTSKQQEKTKESLSLNQGNSHSESVGK